MKRIIIALLLASLLVLTACGSSAPARADFSTPEGTFATLQNAVKNEDAATMYQGFSNNYKDEFGLSYALFEQDFVNSRAMYEQVFLSSIKETVDNGDAIIIVTTNNDVIIFVSELGLWKIAGVAPVEGEPVQ